MKQFVISYSETICRTIIVDAESEREAIEKMDAAVMDGSIELDAAKDYICDSGDISCVGEASDIDLTLFRNLSCYTE